MMLTETAERKPGSAPLLKKIPSYSCRLNRERERGKRGVEMPAEGEKNLSAAAPIRLCDHPSDRSAVSGRRADRSGIPERTDGNQKPPEKPY